MGNYKSFVQRRKMVQSDRRKRCHPNDQYEESHHSLKSWEKKKTNPEEYQAGLYSLELAMETVASTFRSERLPTNHYNCKCMSPYKTHHKAFPENWKDQRYLKHPPNLEIKKLLNTRDGLQTVEKFPQLEQKLLVETMIRWQTTVDNQFIALISDSYIKKPLAITYNFLLTIKASKIDI